MIKKIFSNIFLASLLLFFACNEKEDAVTVWIGGEIVNPTSNYIILAQGNKVIDTVLLDSNNFFLYRSDALKEGLYIIRHNETQVMYVESGDSLMLHLNTIDFDESLAYSGKGAEKNNLLMSFFLINENENKVLPQWYTLSPDAYTQKIDSLKVSKEALYDQFLNKHPNATEGFKKVARVSIDYDYYLKKELYALGNTHRAASIDDSFFAYRQQIDINNEKLRYYYPYYRFLLVYFDNLAAKQLGDASERYSYEFSNARLNAIQQAISNDSIRNNLARNTALRFYFNGHRKQDELEKFLTDFDNINNNPKYIAEVQKVHNTAIKIAAGKTVPNISLLTADNNVTTLHELIDKPTVLFFWSYKYLRQAESIHNRAGELKAKYPEYNFISINTDDHFRRWRNFIRTQKYEDSEEFQLENPVDSEHALMLNNLSKSLIIDTDLTILNGNCTMFQPNFEQLLLGYLNRQD